MEVPWHHGKTVKRTRLTTVLIVSSLFALTIFGLVAVHGSFDMKAECVRRLHLARQHARELPLRLWSERIETSRQKCSGALDELELYWESFRREANYGVASELIYKICSPRHLNFEKWAFRSIRGPFSLGIWAYYVVPMLVCVLAIPFTWWISPGLCAGFTNALQTMINSGVRTYFLWVPEIALLWILRWLFATSLTGHLVFAGYNLTWALVHLFITLPQSEIPDGVKTTVTISVLFSATFVVILQGFTLYTTFRFIHADSDVTITSILFFWLMLLQGELYPFFFNIVRSPFNLFVVCRRCFQTRLGVLVKED